MEDFDGYLHPVGHLDLQDTVMGAVLDCILLWDVRDGWLTPS